MRYDYDLAVIGLGPASEEDRIDSVLAADDAVTVVVEADARIRPAPLHRFLRVHPIAGVPDLLDALIGPDAYTYLFDGQLGYLDYAMSNSTLTGQVAGREVRTIEHLGGPTGLSAIQSAFVDAGVVQCGYCTPAMILAVVEHFLILRRMSRDRGIKPSGFSLPLFAACLILILGVATMFLILASGDLDGGAANSSGLADSFGFGNE